MPSLREFTANTLLPRLIEDARRHRIFNEADQQSRAAYHLYDGYVRQYNNVYLLNQPHLRIGMGRGATAAKPDIVIADENGPFSAYELKCFLESAQPPSMAKHVWADIDQLRKFRQRFPDSEYAFVLVLVDVPDIEGFKALDRELRRDREPWMKHYLRRHIVNLYCDENYRRRTHYEAWAKKWLALREQCNLT